MEKKKINAGGRGITDYSPEYDRASTTRKPLITSCWVQLMEPEKVACTVATFLNQDSIYRL